MTAPTRATSTQPELAIVSVPSTGTWFTIKLLGQLGCAIDYTQHLEPWPVNEQDTIVVPLRDPVLSEITAMNRCAPSHLRSWLRLATLQDRPKTHFVRVDQPRADEVERLARFLDVDAPDEVDWRPRRSVPDPLDRKGRYARGVLDDMSYAISWLQSPEADPVRELFVGCHYPWMD